MAITINSDRINIGDTVVQITPTGIQVVNGHFRAQAIAPSTTTGAMGSNYGYATGGRTGVPGLNDQTNIEKIERWSLTSDGNSASVGALSGAGGGIGMFNNSSITSAYASGGYAGPPYFSPPGAGNRRSGINKFPFASSANSTSIGALSTNIGNPSTGRSDGASLTSEASGYQASGQDGADYRVTVSKFPFATDTNATTVSQVNQQRSGSTGASSSSYGYVIAGNQNPTTNVEKVSFATDSNAVSIGQLLGVGRSSQASQNSLTSAYVSGGYPDPGGSPAVISSIERFPFASDVPATSVGSITQARRGGPAGVSSTTSGYTAGGYAAASWSSVIDKFPFATDTNAVSTGSLLSGKGFFGGHGNVY